MQPLVKKVLIGIAFVAFVASGLWQFNWSPLNLILGPQYVAPKRASGDSRSTFIREIVPRMYPRLVQSRSGGIETVSWNSQSGESQQQTLTLTTQGLVIETAIFTGTSPSAASTSSASTAVQMLDTNLDGRMDSIRYVDPSGSVHTFQEPFDETSQYLWDSALAIAFRFGKCCR
jgi:hypothetical protein